MVPPPIITANRAELTTLVSNNFLGQNTGAIANNEADYLSMWIQDALGMDTYQQASTGAAGALPAQTAAPMVTSGSQSAAARLRQPADSSDSLAVGIIIAVADLFGYGATGATGRRADVAGQLGDLSSGSGHSYRRQSLCCTASRFRASTTWACWAARPLVCS